MNCINRYALKFQLNNNNERLFCCHEMRLISFSSKKMTHQYIMCIFSFIFNYKYSSLTVGLLHIYNNVSLFELLINLFRISY